MGSSIEYQRSSDPSRESRLLDAAAGLFVHYGFDKTTVAEIAREAGVSKGAVYLHFESKDELLEALILRELQAYADSWLGAVENHPSGGSIGGMVRCAMQALHGHPLMVAILRSDVGVFGNYLRKPESLLRRARGRSTRKAFVEAMQAAGVIRTDVDPAVTAHIMNMLSFGLVAIEQVIEADEAPPLDALLDGIAEFMDRALTPVGGGNHEAGKAILREFRAAGQERLAKVTHAG